MNDLQATDGLRVMRFYSENIKKLKVVEFIPDRNIVTITGRNEQGKTSTIDSLFWALCGKKNVQELPIRKGQEKAKTVCDLGEYIITRTYTKADTYLTIETKDGSKISAPQELLDDIINKNTFDPSEFANATSKKQREMLVSALRIPGNRETVIKALPEWAETIDIEATEVLDVLDEIDEYLYALRRSANRDAKEKSASVKTKGKPEKVEEIDVGAVAVALMKNKEKQTKLDNTIKAIEHECECINEIAGKIEANENEIKKLKKYNAEFEVMIEHSRERITTWKAKLNAIDKTGLAEEITEQEKQIADAKETNKKATLWNEYQKELEAVEKAEKRVEGIESKMTIVDKYRAEVQSDIAFPVEGLDITADGVLYNGIPLDQASSAERLTVSLAVVMELNPVARIIRISDASLLDKEHREIIKKIVIEKDYQVWQEFVSEPEKDGDYSTTVGIYIEEGEVKAIDGKEPPPLPVKKTDKKSKRKTTAQKKERLVDAVPVEEKEPSDKVDHELDLDW